MNRTEMMHRLENHGGDYEEKLNDDVDVERSEPTSAAKSMDSEGKREVFYVDENDSDGFEIL